MKWFDIITFAIIVLTILFYGNYLENKETVNCTNAEMEVLELKQVLRVFMNKDIIKLESK